MKDNPQTLMLLIVASLIVIVTLVGGIVTIVDSSDLSFHDYIQDITVIIAALGIGAGIGQINSQ